MNNKVSHVDEHGNTSMVDISSKSVTQREASAECQIKMTSDIFNHLQENGFTTKKGSIIQTAIIAATSAVKKTWDIIPLCHPIPINSIKVKIDPIKTGFQIQCTVKSEGKTGVEMEALHGASTAALTIYDMCKALGHDMYVKDLQVASKSGGKNDFQK